MIVVDTTVWVDFFHDRDRAHVDELATLIETDAGVALTDLILQGISTERQVRLVEQHLGAFDILRLGELDDFRRAARLYRTVRRRGITIRKTVDCLIASVCIRDDASILHNDADFDHLARCTPLRIHAC